MMCVRGKAGDNWRVERNDFFLVVIVEHGQEGDSNLPLVLDRVGDPGLSDRYSCLLPP